MNFHLELGNEISLLLDNLQKKDEEQRGQMFQLNSEINLLKTQNTLFEQRLSSLKEENEQLLQIVQRFQEESQKNLDYEGKIVECKENYFILSKEFEQHKIQSEERIIHLIHQVKLLERQKEDILLIHQEECINLISEHQKQIKTLTNLTKKLQEENKNQMEEIEMFKSTREKLNRSSQQQQNELQTLLAEKIGEIHKLQKELNDKERQHSELLQKARMKYEEHLLEVTMQVNNGSNNSENLSESYRKKMFAQKQAADKEIGDLKRKIASYEELSKKKSRVSIP